MSPRSPRRITLDVTGLTLEAGQAEVQPLREELELILAGDEGDPLEALLDLTAELYVTWGRMIAVQIAEQLIRDGHDAHIQGLEPGDLEGPA